MSRLGPFELDSIVVGDCTNHLHELPDESVTAVLCDPPYGLSKQPDMRKVLAAWLNDEEYRGATGGFMDKEWDSFVPGPAVWKEIYRVMKPGAVLLAFGGTRTADLLGLALRLAGFEIADTVMWLYGAGFPKSLSISKAIDKAAGIEREVIGRRPIAYPDSDCWGIANRNSQGGKIFGKDSALPTGNGIMPGGTPITVPATEAAKTWSGWGTSLKPGYEPVILARRPRKGTYAQTAVEHGAGALNIDGCRIGTAQDHPGVHKSFSNELHEGYRRPWRDGTPPEYYETPNGRWPANLVLCHTPECRRAGVRKVKGAGWRESDRECEIPSPEGFGGKRLGNAPMTYADEDGLEAIEAWECAGGGLAETYELSNSWVTMTPFDSTETLMEKFHLLLDRLRQLEDSRDIHTGGKHITMGYELGCALGLSALPSFRLCCPSCLHSYDELVHTVLEDDLISVRQLHDVLCFVYSALCLRVHNLENPSAVPLSNLDDFHGIRLLPCIAENSTSEGHLDCESVAETFSGILDMAVQEFGPLAIENNMLANRISDLVWNCERIDHTACTETLVCLFVWLAFETSCDLFSGKVYHRTLELSSCPVKMLDEMSGERPSGGVAGNRTRPEATQNCYGKYMPLNYPKETSRPPDTGGASRFFYTAKSSRRERNEGLPEGMQNNHPTVKSLALTEYLARLVRPPEEYLDDAIILIPFCGTGSEVIGALKAGWRHWLGIEIDEQYAEIARARIAHWQAELERERVARIQLEMLL